MRGDGRNIRTPGLNRGAGQRANASQLPPPAAGRTASKLNRSARKSRDTLPSTPTFLTLRGRPLHRDPLEANLKKKRETDLNTPQFRMKGVRGDGLHLAFVIVVGFMSFDLQTFGLGVTDRCVIVLRIDAWTAPGGPNIN